MKRQLLVTISLGSIMTAMTRHELAVNPTLPGTSGNDRPGVPATQ